MLKAEPKFRGRFPWWGADLQTLRDTLRPPRLPQYQGIPVTIALAAGASLLAFHDRLAEPLGLVLLLHGLGGSSDREGLRRLGVALQTAGFEVLRLNLRGAGQGRPLAPGTYAAHCNRDLLPALACARQLAAGRPLFGVGLSLGGTILLNACLPENPQELSVQGPRLLDGLVCISSPLDLALCSAAIERPRNFIYQRWLLRRLVRQTLEDPFSVTLAERLALGQVRNIREFDGAITAPRWGFKSVDHYYLEASPIHRLLPGSALKGSPESFPKDSQTSLPCPTLLIQAEDDSWVPASSIRSLAAGPTPAGLELVLSSGGGHNGFHGRGDRPLACWSDQLAVGWLQALLA